MRLVLNLREMKINVKNFFLHGILKTEDEIREYIKDSVEWDDVAEKLGKTYTREDRYARDYEEARTDMTISEMEECFEEYVGGVIEAIKMGEEKFYITYQEVEYKLILEDSEAFIQNPKVLAITDWIKIRKEEVVLDVCEPFSYNLTHLKDGGLSNVCFTGHVILTEEEWNEANESITSGKCSLETIFRDKFNEYLEETKFAIFFERGGE